MASEQDRANWANRIEERRTSYAEPLILRPYADLLVGVGLLPEPDGNIVALWPDAFAPSPLERAQTMAQTARAATNLSKALESPAVFITQAEARATLQLPELPSTPLKTISPPDAGNEEEEKPPLQRAAEVKPHLKAVK